jgi:hypothetical protein
MLGNQDGEGEYRQPTRLERQLLERLVDFSKAGPDLKRQATTCRVKTIEEHGDNYGSFDIEVAGERNYRDMLIVADALASDIDGGLVEAILYVSEGRLFELEILRPDGSPLLKMPDPSEFQPAPGFA